jgi:hypothetical protein
MRALRLRRTIVTDTDSNDGSFVTVYETTQQNEVSVLKMALRDAGIEFFAVNDTVSTVLPFDGMARVRFQVAPADAAEVRQVLDRLGLE